MSTPLTHPTEPSAAWSSTTTVDSGRQACRPILTIAPDNRPHAIWERDGSLYHSFLGSQRWHQPTRLIGGTEPSADYGPGGTLHVVFANNYSGQYEIYYTWWQGREWAMPKNVSWTRGPSRQPAIIRAPNGILHVFWADETPGYSVIYHGHNRGGHWQNYPIPHAAGTRPVVAAGPDGTLHVVFQARLGANRTEQIYYTAWQNNVWLTPQLISSGDTASSAATLAVDAGGRVHAVWRQHQPEGDMTYYASGRPGAWAYPRAISPLLAAGSGPALAVAQSAYLHVIWPHLDAVEQVQRFISGSDWEPVELAAVESYPVTDLNLIAQRTGQIHAAWVCQLSERDRKSTRLNSSHIPLSRMPSSA